MDDSNSRGALTAQLGRERALDIDERLRPFRRSGFTALAIAVAFAAPWVGWWALLPLLAAALVTGLVSRVAQHRKRPELWLAVGWAVTPLMIGVCVIGTGGAWSPALPWFALPAVTLASRFGPRMTLAGTLFLGLVVLGSATAPDPSAVAADPSFVVLTLGLVVAVVIFSGAVVRSDYEHRLSAALDPLTGLFNRAALGQRLSDADEAMRSGREPAATGVLIGDIDHFKRINDRHGHSAGDLVLRDVAAVIADSLRPQDAAYRVGGEEFLVLVEGADREELAAIGERLRRAVTNCSDARIPVTMSFGGAVGIDFTAVHAAADAAMYEAKQAGRNRVLITDQAPTRRERRQAAEALETIEAAAIS